MLVALDLDFTLWDCGGLWIDHTNPPFVHKKGKVFDSRGRQFSLYPQSKMVLDYLSDQKISIAAVSRTHEPGWARDLLDLYELSSYFDYKEIYPGSKIQHFSALQKKCGIPFNRMLFFDDEQRNIEEVSHLGIFCTFIPRGINLAVVKQALQHISE